MHILTQTHAKWYQCLCEYCTNIDLHVKLKEVNKQVTQQKKSCRIRDIYFAAEITMCPDLVETYSGRFNNLACIYRKCEKCGTHQLGDYLKGIREIDNIDPKELTWQKWGQEQYLGRPKKCLLRVQGTLDDLIVELSAELEPYSRHLFTAKWQQNQFSALIKNAPPESVVMIMDFSENFTCLTQNEVQSAHWSHTQVTLYPFVCFYYCSDCDSQEVVREAIHVVSNDLQHDAHSVHFYTRVATSFLCNKRGLKVSREIQWSDGCASQYKSRTPFMDISHASHDLHVPLVERHFFGSRHGKNPCDGEGGVVKSAAARAIKSDDSVCIQDANAFFDFCCRQLTKARCDGEGNCQHSRRCFLYVDKVEIPRNRPDRRNTCWYDISASCC